MTDFEAVAIVEEIDGPTSDDEKVEAMQALMDSGAVWHLQGSYGRLAAEMLRAGLIHD
jgi:hypothetical protein